MCLIRVRAKLCRSGPDLRMAALRSRGLTIVRPQVHIKCFILDRADCKKNRWRFTLMNRRKDKKVNRMTMPENAHLIKNVFLVIAIPPFSLVL